MAQGKTLRADLQSLPTLKVSNKNAECSSPSATDSQSHLS